MKMSHKRKILLFKSCLLVTYQLFFFFFVFYTYIFLIHKIHHKISTARNPDKHQPLVCEQDNWTQSSWGTSWPVPEGSSVWSSLWWPILSVVATSGRHSWHVLVPAMPSCPHSLPALLLLLLQSRNYHGGSARGERGNRSSLGHQVTALGRAECPDCPPCAREPLAHVGSTATCPLSSAGGPVSLGAGTQLHSSCPTAHQGEFPKHSKLS